MHICECIPLVSKQMSVFYVNSAYPQPLTHQSTNTLQHFQTGGLIFSLFIGWHLCNTELFTHLWAGQWYLMTAGSPSFQKTILAARSDGV